MWLTNGTAVQGRGHISEGTPCQDKIASKSNDTATVIALADGAGSAPLSHLGAQGCVETITQYFLEHFEECYACDEDTLKRSIYETLLHRLNDIALENHCAIKDLASTLLCVAGKGDRFITIHLGDGMIACFDGQVMKVYSSPDNGEFANVTHFVTSANALEKMRIRKEKRPDVIAFYLMSDGAGTSLYNPRENAASNALKMMSDLSLLYSEEDVNKELTAFFEQSVRAKTLDDCSVLFMVKYQRTIDAFVQMPYAEQLSLLKIENGSKNARKRYKRYCEIMDTCDTEKSITDIMKRIRLRPKYGKRYMDVLIEAGLLKKEAQNRYINAKESR